MADLTCEPLQQLLTTLLTTGTVTHSNSLSQLQTTADRCAQMCTGQAYLGQAQPAALHVGAACDTRLLNRLTTTHQPVALRDDSSMSVVYLGGMALAGFAVTTDFCLAGFRYEPAIAAYHQHS